LTENQFFGQNTATVGQKPAAADKNRFYLGKIGRISSKPDATDEIRALPINTERDAKKPTASDSVPGFIDVSGHKQIRAASIFNTDVLLKEKNLWVPKIGTNKRETNWSRDV
jgi:hypothetical protein